MPPDSAARSTTTEPGFICSTIAAVTSIGACRPGHGRRRDQRVGGRDVRGQQVALPGGAVLGHLACVAAGALERLELELDRHRAHRADLLGRRCPHVVRLDDRAEPLAGGDRLQPRDAGAEHDDLGGRDGAGRGHVEREEAAQPLAATIAQR